MSHPNLKPPVILNVFIVGLILGLATVPNGDRAMAQSSPSQETDTLQVTLQPVGGEPLVAMPSTAPATTTSAAPEGKVAEGKKGWLAQKYMTGDWGGTRTKLSDAGIDINVEWMNQFMLNMYGGLETRNGHDTAGSYELNLNFDFEKIAKIKGGSFFIRGKGTWGGDDSDFDREKIGGLFRTNGDGAEEKAIFVDKWWWKQLLFDKKVELRLGRMEPTKDLFDTSKVIGHEDRYFLNQALVRNATIPSNKGLGAYVNWDVTKHMYVRAAVIDAQSEDYQTNFNTAFHDEDWFRFYAEVGCKPKLNSSSGKLWGHYRVGTWYDPTIKTRNFNTLGGRLATRLDTGDWGFYTGFDQMVWKENPDEKDMQGVTIAARYGWADGEVNRFDNFWAAAVQYEGLVPDRNKDVVAFGIGQGILSDELRRVRPTADSETVYELYYLFYLGPWLQVTPTFQYIHQAGGDENDNDAAVFGFRVRMLL